VNAGHCEPLLVRADGEVETLPATGLPVGLLEPATYASASLRLKPGDLLMLYTDGVTDAESSEAERFGERRLRQIASCCAGRGCGVMLETVRQALRLFTEGAVQKDDVTVLILEYLPDNTP
jgi:sigma-B regulation protein RsbU (phosphoserine phosphatase)